jgi:hypothetical protein
MPLSALPPNPLLDSLGRYPPWVVAVGLAVVAAAALWILVKLLKWSLYLLLGLVLVGGIAAIVWLLWH